MAPPRQVRDAAWLTGALEASLHWSPDMTESVLGLILQASGPGGGAGHLRDGACRQPVTLQYHNKGSLTRLHLGLSTPL
jgi:hypothetical protein